MKSILKNYFSIVLLLAFPIIVNAQKDKDVKKYKEEAETIRKEVWGWNKPQFTVRNIPPDYTGASKVIIAKHFEINTDEKKIITKFRYGATADRVIIVTEISRHLVKINDKSALSEYSEMKFTQLQKKGTANHVTTYIGGKVIKPNGSVIEINENDVVLTKDENDLKEAKLAIPDIQVGDIFDYYIARKIVKQDHPDGVRVAEYAISFFDVSPVINYSFRSEIGDRYAIEYRNYNGAPVLKQSKGNNSNVLEFEVKNIPAYPEMNLWISPYRQLPILRINILLPDKGLLAGRTNPRSPGKIYVYENSDEFIEDEKIKIGSVKYPRGGSIYKLKDYTTVTEITSDYFKQLSKNKDKLTPDSLASELFYIYRFNLLDFGPYSDIDDILNKNNSSINESRFVYNLGDFFKKVDIDNQLVFVSPLNSPPIKEIMNKNEIHYLVSIQGSKPRFFGMTDIFTPAFYIPQQYENVQQAITLDTKGEKTFKPKDFDQGTVNVPGTSASQNTRIENLIVTLHAANEYLQIERRTTLKGHYKSDEQKRLILVEDYYNAERKMFKATETIVEELAKDKKSKKFAEELKAAFDQARSRNKDAFIAEAKEWFEQEITELKDQKLENLGVRHTSPDFIYSSKFKMGGLVKKAGNNLIIEVGKLQGSPLKVNNDQRKRTLDVYAPFARSLQFNITLQIPEGYTAEGIASLNKKVDNETGFFIVEASLDEKQITIQVKKSYNHSFEPAANWDKLLAFIDAANDWTNARILLKKK